MGAGYPGPRICRTFTRKGAAVSSQGLPEIAGPPCGPLESRPRRWEFRTSKCESRPRHSDFFTAKRESRLRRPDFFTAKCESRPRRPDFFTAKRESRLRCPVFFTAKCASRPRRPDFFTAKCESRLPRPDFSTAKRESRPSRPDFSTAKCESRLRRPDFFTAKRESRPRRSPLPGRAFSAARPAGTARFLITRGKASFYETATFGRRKVFFCSPFCGLLFCPTRAKLALPAGGKARRPKPRPPRGGPPNDRDRLPVFAPPARTPDPATPPQSACSRRLSGCPQRPNLSARRRAESPKGKRKGGSPMKRAPPL